MRRSVLRSSCRTGLADTPPKWRAFSVSSTLVGWLTTNCCPNIALQVMGRRACQWGRGNSMIVTDRRLIDMMDAHVASWCSSIGTLQSTCSHTTMYVRSGRAGSCGEGPPGAILLHGVMLRRASTRGCRDAAGRISKNGCPGPSNMQQQKEAAKRVTGPDRVRGP